MAETLRVDDSWVIVGAQGRLLGRVVGDAAGPIDPKKAAELVQNLVAGQVVWLEPAYEINIGMQMLADGRTALAVQVVPECMMAHSRPMQVVADTLRKVAGMHEGDRRMVAEWVRKGEETRTQIRASQAGIEAPNGAGVFTPGG